MRSAKEIEVKPISGRDAARVVSRFHYSGRVVQNSQLNFGVFLDGKCHGAMQFGPSMDKRKVAGIVRGTGWHQFIELNRMAFGDALPRNSESRAIGIAFRIMRKNYPQLKWVISFADATQCGDGAIYRASGFVLTGMKKNTQIYDVPGYGIFHALSFAKARPTKVQSLLRQKFDLPDASGVKVLKTANARLLNGFQMRYVRFLDPSWVDRLAVPSIPFEKIREIGAAMYRGERVRSETSDTPEVHSGEDGATPIRTLHP